MDLRTERGLTLTELVVVGVLATLVMLALTGFYFNSQRTWLEGSSQALTQREATLVVEHLARRVRASSQANVTGLPPFQTLTLFGPGGDQTHQFTAVEVSGDFLLHEYQPDDLHDLGPVVSSKILRFELDAGDSLVDLTLLELLSATDDTVRIGSRFALYNR